MKTPNETTIALSGARAGVRSVNAIGGVNEPTLYVMSQSRHLPMWSQRIFNGMFSAVMQATLGLYWFTEPAGSWRHTISLCVIWNHPSSALLSSPFASFN